MLPPRGGARITQRAYLFVLAPRRSMAAAPLLHEYATVTELHPSLKEAKTHNLGLDALPSWTFGFRPLTGDLVPSALVGGLLHEASRCFSHSCFEATWAAGHLQADYFKARPSALHDVPLQWTVAGVDQ